VKSSTTRIINTIKEIETTIRVVFDAVVSDGIGVGVDVVVVEVVPVPLVIVVVVLVVVSTLVPDGVVGVEVRRLVILSLMVREQFSTSLSKSSPDAVTSLTYIEQQSTKQLGGVGRIGSGSGRDGRGLASNQAL